MNTCTRRNGKTCEEQGYTLDDCCPPCANDYRADLGESAVHAFADAAGMRDENGYTDELGAVVSDLLSDLMHYCEREEVDFTAISHRASEHYSMERDG